MRVSCCIKMPRQNYDGMSMEWMETEIEISDKELVDMIDEYFEIKKKETDIDELDGNERLQE